MMVRWYRCAASVSDVSMETCASHTPPYLVFSSILPQVYRQLHCICQPERQHLRVLLVLLCSEQENPSNLQENPSHILSLPTPSTPPISYSLSLPTPSTPPISYSLSPNPLLPLHLSPIPSHPTHSFHSTYLLFPLTQPTPSTPPISYSLSPHPLLPLHLSPIPSHPTHSFHSTYLLFPLTPPTLSYSHPPPTPSLYNLRSESFGHLVGGG